MLIHLYHSGKFSLKYYSLSLLFFLTAFFSASAQGKYCVEEIEGLGLPSLPGKVLTHYSAGHKNRASDLKRLLESASKVFEDSLGLKIEIMMAILDSKDWAGLMDKPYGLPTMRSGSCKRSRDSFPRARYAAIMPAGIDGALYDGWIALKDSLSQTTRQSLQEAAVGFEDGGKVLIDFVALHELGHAFAHAFGINYHVNFFAEFIADYLAFAFLRYTPERLDKKVLAVLAANIDAIRPVHSSFYKYETFRSSEHPPTEAWYNSVITLKAAEIYNERGFEFLYAVRKAFTEGEGQLKTEAIINRLETIHPGIAKWALSISEQVRLK